MRQRETEDVASRGDRDVLYSVHGISHRRGMDVLSRGEVPQRRAIARVERNSLIAAGNKYDAIRDHRRNFHALGIV